VREEPACPEPFKKRKAIGQFSISSGLRMSTVEGPGPPLQGGRYPTDLLSAPLPFENRFDQLSWGSEKKTCADVPAWREDFFGLEFDDLTEWALMEPLALFDRNVLDLERVHVMRFGEPRLPTLDTTIDAAIRFLIIDTGFVPNVTLVDTPSIAPIHWLDLLASWLEDTSEPAFDIHVLAGTVRQQRRRRLRKELRREKALRVIHRAPPSIKPIATPQTSPWLGQRSTRDRRFM